jgi:methyl-accepting chemotaxis protein
MWFREKARARRVESRRLKELEGLAAAMDRSQAVVEFRLNGTVVRASTPFLGLTGYAPAEIIGCPHSMFLSDDETGSLAYRDFWRALGRGESICRKVRWYGKDRTAFWVQASYGPIVSGSGKVSRIVLFITDLTDIHAEESRPKSPTARVAAQDEVIAVLADQFKALAKGDLATRITASFDASYAHVKHDFNAALDGLGQTMSAISAAAGGLGASSDAVARVSHDLSRRTGRQASDLIEARTSLAKLTLAAARATENARQASGLTADTRADAGGSRKVMREAVGLMGEIEQSYARISQTAAMVEEVASRAHVLALISGVEARRSVVAGGGFSVVVEEVRGLAQRASEAAKEIRDSVAANRAQLTRGVRLVGDVEVSLGGMSTRITQIDGLVAKVAKAAMEQAAGLDQIKTVINRVDTVAQDHVDMVGEAAVVSSKLIDEADGLIRVISPYRATVTSRPTLHVEPAQPCRHAPAGNAVAKAQARIAAFARPSQANGPTPPDQDQDWDRRWDEQAERSAAAL